MTANAKKIGTIVLGFLMQLVPWKMLNVARLVRKANQLPDPLVDRRLTVLHKQYNLPGLDADTRDMEDQLELLRLQQGLDPTNPLRTAVDRRTFPFGPHW